MKSTSLTGVMEITLNIPKKRRHCCQSWYNSVLAWCEMWHVDGMLYMITVRLSLFY